MSRFARSWIPAAVLLGGCPESSSLGVTVEGPGTVTSNPPGIDCTGAGGTCTMSIDPSVTIELIQTAAPTGSEFSGWSGSCGGTERCLVDGSAGGSVGARFVEATRMLKVVTSGKGAYRVDSTPAGIVCGTGPQPVCSLQVPKNVKVTLTSTFDAGSTRFLGWQGEPTCSTDPTCHVTLDRDRQIDVTFNVRLFLTVKVAGPGVVTGPGISCPGQCRAEFAAGDTLTLHPMPAANATFVGWLGVCPGMIDCTLSPMFQTTVTADFAAQ